MTAPDPLRRVVRTGWTAMGLGAVCLVLAGLQFAIPIVLSRLTAALAADEDPAARRVREAFAEGAGWSAALNLAFGVALIAIGQGVVRRAPWSHRALTTASWLSIVALFALAKPSVAPLLAVAGEAKDTNVALVVTSLGLLLAQIAAVLWFLRFWRREEVRALFRRG